MISFPFQSDKGKYSMKIELPPDFDLGCILIWNFNADLTIGVKECTIYFNNKKIFSGIIKKGVGNATKLLYCTVINLTDRYMHNNRLKMLLSKYFHKRVHTPLIKKKTPSIFIQNNRNIIDSKILENEFLNSLTPKKRKKDFKNRSLREHLFKSEIINEKKIKQPFYQSSNMNLIFESQKW